MTLPLTTAAFAAACLPELAHPNGKAGPKAPLLFAVARSLETQLSAGQTVDARALRSAMETAFGASDADGAWLWKDAYEALEAAQLLFLRSHGPAIRAKAAGSARAMLAMLSRLLRLIPTQTRRSEESQTLQQFSTPIELGFIASVAARLSPFDLVLEPSAGTGLLAIFAELAGAHLHLNELAELRAGLLAQAFPQLRVTRHNAEHIHDYLDADIQPSLVLMNPPFSVSPQVDARVTSAAGRHIISAFARLVPGGRLVAVTPQSLDLDTPSWRKTFATLGPSQVIFSAIISGTVYARHGTAVETRLTVIDKYPAGPGQARANLLIAQTAEEVLELVETHVPIRKPLEITRDPVRSTSVTAQFSPAKTPPQRSSPKAASGLAPDLDPANAIELAYAISREADADPLLGSTALYETYRLQRISIAGVAPHPTPLVQSAAMASVMPPAPTYQPHLPARVLSAGLLSEAQLESVIYAGEAHQAFLSGYYTINESFDRLTPAGEGDEGALRFRRGWFLGDGTGAGKGRQAAGIIADNWIKGRRKAVWISKSDKLIEDAKRDWAAIGGEPLQIVPLARYPQGTGIRLDEGVLFTTYATLRTGEARNKPSRLTQILAWLGREFDGVIIFDEAHAMANAAGSASERGDKAPSQQGLAVLSE